MRMTSFLLALAASATVSSVAFAQDSYVIGLTGALTGPPASTYAPAVEALRVYLDRVQTLSGLVAHSDPRETTLGGDTPQEAFGMIVSCNYFAVLQEPPALGRALTARDCEPDADPVVVLGHTVWTTTFAADPGIVGRTVELDRQRFTVVGVAAEGTYGASPMRTAYFAPLSAEPLLWPGASRFKDDKIRWLYLIGRRRDTAALNQVRAEFDDAFGKEARWFPSQKPRTELWLPAAS